MSKYLKFKIREFFNHYILCCFFFFSFLVNNVKQKKKETVKFYKSNQKFGKGFSVYWSYRYKYFKLSVSLQNKIIIIYYKTELVKYKNLDTYF